MKRAGRTVLLIIAAMALLSCISSASADSVIDEQSEAAGINEVEEALDTEAAQMLDGASASDTDQTNTLKKLLSSLKGALPGVFRSALRAGASVLVISALCGIAQTALDTTESKWSGPASLAGTAAVTLCVFGSSSGFMNLARTTLESLDSFSKVLLPTLSALAATAGAPVSAAAKYAAASLFIDVLMTISENVIMPVICAYAAAVIAEAAFGGSAFSGASSLLKWLSATLMTLAVLAFVIYMSLTGVIAGNADAAALRVAKTAISTALPVVGGIMSDAAASVLSGAGILRSSVGIFGILAVTAVCAVPFIKLAAHFLVFKAVSKISFCSGRMEKLLGGLANVFGLVMGLTGSCALMLYISLISLIKVVTY